MARYKKADTEQFQMVMLNLADLFAPEHPTSMLLSTIQYMDLSKFDENYQNESAGAEAIPPDRMLAAIFWHILHGGISQRALERDLTKRADLLYLTGGLTIDHSTISRFLKRHKDIIKDLFAQTVAIGVDLNFIAGETIAIDGTVVKG